MLIYFPVHNIELVSDYYYECLLNLKYCAHVNVSQRSSL